MSSDIYRILQSELDKGKKAVVITLINDRDHRRESPLPKMILTEGELRASHKIQHIDATIVKKVQMSLETGNLQYFQADGGVGILIEPYFPESRLIILGGGNIAKPLADFGAKVGLAVTVVDDRLMFANKNRFPETERVICESFSNCFAQLALNEFDFVVIVTRGQRHDFDCLKQVLNYKTAYTGMIGSKRRVKIIKEQLLAEGYPKELIQKMDAPIGLNIGAVTPEEIAISIIAQVISYRRLAGKISKDSSLGKVNWPELDRLVLKELCQAADDPKALVTVIATKGSVPRKAGAKMLVWPYGKTVGSIGGGCAEGEVINAAWQIIGNGGAMIHEIDLTGQIIEDVVCGGTMRVLIEDYHG